LDPFGATCTRKNKADSGILASSTDYLATETFQPDADQAAIGQKKTRHNRAGFSV